MFSFYTFSDDSDAEYLSSHGISFGFFVVWTKCDILIC